MNKSSHITAFLYIAMSCSGIVMAAGCGIASDLDSFPVTLEIRFQDDLAPTHPSSAGQRRLALAAPSPTTHDTVARILVDITFANSGLPFSANFELTKVAPDVWHGTVPVLPRSQPLRFAARALDTSGAIGFFGETLAALTVDNQYVQIPLAPAENNQTFQIPRMVRIAYPGVMFSGQEGQVVFTIEGNVGAAIDIQIAPIGGSTPAAEFSPTFANNGQGNPGLLQGYTVAHQGTITLAVTDEHNGTTTLHYQLTRDQFADPIAHTSIGGLKRDAQGFAP